MVDDGQKEKVGDDNPAASSCVRDFASAEQGLAQPAKPTIPPEEGLRGWLTCIGAFFGVFASFGVLNVIGIFQITYQEGYLRNYSPSDITWIFALQICLMWSPGPLFGRIIDTYGPLPLLIPGAILEVLGLCMTSLSRTYYQIFLAQGLCFGLGAGAIFSACFVCTGQWFVKRRGLAVGIAAAGSGLGGVILPPFFLNVRSAVGFNGALRYLALFIGLLLLVCIALVRSRLPKKKWDVKTKWFDFGLFREKTFALFTIGAFFGMWGLWAPFDFLTSSAVASGFSTDLAIYLISLVNSTSVFGRVLPPYLGDKFGYFNMVTLSAFASAIAILCLWLPFDFHHSHAGLMVFGLVYGFPSGAWVSLLMPCIAKTGELATLGQRFGTFQLVVGLGTLTGLPIQGAILARQGGDIYWGLQMFAFLSLLISAVLSTCTIFILRRERGTWKV
ncbi:major facilitator superfamily domain-containing protein [Neohortaea acidophila]|uniref:Major facilitator superfamily domain-containing protein n=1 Tax=Neohortaea acidophila TaxID=245834 RepID=A0A6A6Q5Q5_9PEZI|nr:major facilitator superfamily domain-containing protein [Neohortaea acidophila]KAF2487778.1 major facilitator superfamily domain-containing protein [Neohortaea acidophila]